MFGSSAVLKNSRSGVEWAFRNRIRREILVLLDRVPGVTVTGVSERLRVDYSTANYHIRRLVKVGLVHVVARGRGVHCFRVGVSARVEEVACFKRNLDAARLLDAVSAVPGLSIRGLAEGTGLSVAKVRYHLAEGVSRGLLRVTRQGFKIIVWPNES